MTITVVNSLDQFHQIINSDKVSVFDFWAEWCGPCRAISPVFEKLASLPENSSVGFYKVDIDAQADIAQEVGVRSIPLFNAYQSGNKVNEVLGANPSSLQTLIAGLK